MSIESRVAHEIGCYGIQKNVSIYVVEFNATAAELMGAPMYSQIHNLSTSPDSQRLQDGKIAAKPIKK